MKKQPNRKNKNPKTKNNQMPEQDESLISHLEALRTTLIKCFTALGICLFPMFFLSPYIMDILIQIMLGENKISLNYFSPMEVFILQIKIALLLDICICFPYIAKKIWDFILPALYEHERKFIKSIVLSSSLLFVCGVSFCIFFILPLIINFGISFSTEKIQAVLGISNIISLGLGLSFIFGIMFQFPLVTYSLICSQIVSYESIQNKRPYIFVGILIIAAILTPPDIVSQIMLATPTYLLFEGALYAARKKIKKNLT